MVVASPHASRVVKQLPGWPMGTLGNAGTAAGGPKIHDNFMRSRAGLFSPAAGAFGSQEMVFGAYIFGGWDFEFWKKSFRWKAFNPQPSGGGKLRYHKCPHFSVEAQTIQMFCFDWTAANSNWHPTPSHGHRWQPNVWQTSGWGLPAEQMMRRSLRHSKK